MNHFLLPHEGMTAGRRGCAAWAPDAQEPGPDGRGALLSVRARTLRFRVP